MCEQNRNSSEPASFLLFWTSFERFFGVLSLFPCLGERSSALIWNLLKWDLKSIGKSKVIFKHQFYPELLLREYIYVRGMTSEIEEWAGKRGEGNNQDKREREDEDWVNVEKLSRESLRHASDLHNLELQRRKKSSLNRSNLQLICHSHQRFNLPSIDLLICSTQSCWDYFLCGRWSWINLLSKHRSLPWAGSLFLWPLHWHSIDFWSIYEPMNNVRCS